MNSIEALDLGQGDSGTEIKIDELNAINFSEVANEFMANFTSEGSLGSGLGGSSESILIDGDANDIVNLLVSDEDTLSGWLEVDSGGGYTAYDFFDAGGNVLASVAIDDDVVVNAVMPPPA